jgi:periplasmic glucans biosynthesis protein
MKKAFVCVLMALAAGRVSAAPAPLEMGRPAPFDFAALTARAQALAARPYVPADRPAPEIVGQIGYDEHGKLRFRPGAALGAEGPGLYPATFFHLGRLFPARVRMYALEGGQAREIRYAPRYFEMPPDSPARRLPADAGFAGFRLHESRRRADWRTQDWAAFLGASYFRAIGELGQYGLSARGLAVDTAIPGPEEFPQFTSFYIAPALTAADPVEVHALLEGPSVAGAYRFALRRGEGVVMEVEARVFLREDVERLGIAPLTSMFWYGEGSRVRGDDWRPEVHDSDGLALWTGGGERLWRPLKNAPYTIASAFADENPRGFGLLQRDREPGHYLDGVNYDLRPSVWVEPLEGWGRGAVELVEIPTDDEIHDNIVAFWRPAQPARAGDRYTFRYRLHWLADEPYPAPQARVVATRTGRGGEPGTTRPLGVRKFVVEFAGGALGELPPGSVPEVVVTASRGTVVRPFVEPVPRTPRWRAVFDIAATGSAPVELRAYLRAGARTLSETWTYQHHP